MAAAIEAILASVNPDVVKSDDLRAQLSASLNQTLRLRNPNIPLQRAVYKGITDLFGRLAKADNAGDGAAAGEDVIAALREHLFRADAGSEANRLLRADAIAAVTAFSKTLAGELRPAILSLAKEDPSSVVRGRLASAADGSETS